MLKKISALSALLLLAALPATAAGGQSGAWEIGPYAGYAWLDSYGGSAPDNDLLYGARVGYFVTSRWSVEASYQFLKTNIAAGGADFKLNSLRLNALYNFREGKPFRWHLTAGLGQESTKITGTSVDQTDLGWNAGAGVRYFFTPKFAVRGDGRFVRTHIGAGLNENQGNAEATVGVSWFLGGGPAPDADGDGVADHRDKCPSTPKGARVDAIGCPTDADHDGVYDGIDTCPDTPKGYPVDAAGCPRDSDGDGVVDGADACAGTPRGAKVDTKGCPTDADGDGVADGLDRCANTPKGAKVDASGCPLDSDADGVADGVDACLGTPKGATVDARGCPKDSDGDGVADGIDTCPDTPAGTPVDAKGCPMVAKAAPLFTDTKKSLVLEGVNFNSNSAVLTPDSSAVLDKVAASLTDWPDVKVEIDGYTDARGADAYNVSLSRKRAQAVVSYLVAKGVDGSRMSSKGNGKADPIADNGTDAGRAKNRRVELHKAD
ncbi:MAG: OmpA family protein [Acidobacteria bacterium]|nr:OmpA family protein [Acidobacteriota bacterium]